MVPALPGLYNDPGHPSGCGGRHLLVCGRPSPPANSAAGSTGRPQAADWMRVDWEENRPRSGIARIIRAPCGHRSPCYAYRASVRGRPCDGRGRLLFADDADLPLDRASPASCPAGLHCPRRALSALRPDRPGPPRRRRPTICSSAADRAGAGGRRRGWGPPRFAHVTTLRRRRPDLDLRSNPNRFDDLPLPPVRAALMSTVVAETWTLCGCTTSTGAARRPPLPCSAGQPRGSYSTARWARPS